MKVLQKYDKLFIAAAGIVCFIKVRTAMVAACSVSLAVYSRKIHQSE